MVRYCQSPRALEIQTASFCNGNCIICPYRSVNDHFQRGIMEMGLFKKIISQVATPWSTRIVLYFNNEPFLDPKITERVNYVNKQLPYSEIEISTNLSMFDETMQQKLLSAHISDLRLSVFGFSKESHQKAMPGITWNIVKNNLDNLVGNRKLRAKIDQISLVMIDYPGLPKKDIEQAKKFCEKHYINFKLWGFFDRGKNVESFSNNFYTKTVSGCNQDRPLDRMHILFNGKVVLCCMDWEQEYILGDLTTSNIQEVWDSKKYNDIRKQIYTKENTGPRLCQNCILAK